MSRPLRAPGTYGPEDPGDPAYWMLLDTAHQTKPQVHRDGCYICEDPEFAQMGMPLCQPCPACIGFERGTGHIPADDEECDDCGFNLHEYYDQLRERKAAQSDDWPGVGDVRSPGPERSRDSDGLGQALTD